jgi:hypothetical protein
MMVQEFVNIDKDLQTVQDISNVNIIILIYLFIKHVLFILMHLHKCKMHVTMSVELKVYLFIWSHNFRFSMSLSLSPNSLYRQTTDCTEGGGLTREHCIYKILLKVALSTIKQTNLLCVFTFWVPCCDVHYDFRIRTMFGSFLPPVICLIYIIIPRQRSCKGI